jgi:hypothetical protein
MHFLERWCICLLRRFSLAVQVYLSAGFMGTKHSLLSTSVRKMTDFAYPINIFPWLETRLRDKGNVFLSLLQM